MVGAACKNSCDRGVSSVAGWLAGWEVPQSGTSSTPYSVHATSSVVVFASPGGISCTTSHGHLHGHPPPPLGLRFPPLRSQRQSCCQGPPVQCAQCKARPASNPASEGVQGASLFKQPGALLVLQESTMLRGAPPCPARPGSLRTRARRRRPGKYSAHACVGPYYTRCTSGNEYVPDLIPNIPYPNLAPYDAT